MTCPHCGNADSTRIYSIAANAAKKIRAGLRECQDCHGQFTVRTGGVMESSHVPPTKWTLAYRLMASSKKGMSAHQLHRMLGATYKAAWFMAHRIRETMRPTDDGQLGGEGKTVEADETYVGGKAKNRAYAKTLPRHETDQSPVYTTVGKSFASHLTVNHSIKEYVRGDAHTNTIEGYF